MNALDPRAIVEASRDFVNNKAGEYWHLPYPESARLCYLHGAIEMFKRLQGDATPEPWSDDYDHEARLRELLGIYDAPAGKPMPARCPGELNRVWTAYGCASGCDRISCVASELGFAQFCCRICAESHGRSHSVACDGAWPFLKSLLLSEPSAVSAPTIPSERPLGAETPAPAAEPQAPGTASSTTTAQDCSNKNP